MDLFELSRLLRRRWAVLAAALVVGLVAGWVTAPGASDEPAGYAATTTLLTNPRSTTRLNLQQAALLATTGDVPVIVAEDLGLDSGDVVKGSITATASDDTSSITVRATRPDPEGAEQVSLAVAETLVDFISGGDVSAYEQQIEDLTAAVDQYRTQVDALSATAAPDGGDTDAGRLAELQAAQGQLAAALSSLQQLRTQGPPPAPLLIVEEGDAGEVVPEGVRAPDSKPARALLLGGFGLLVGLGAVVVLDRLDTRVRSKEVAEAAYGTRVLAEIPPLPDARKRADELLAVTDPASPFVEAYRTLRTVVALERVEEDLEGRRPGGRVLLVTSPGPGEGKTTTTAHLAATLAEIGRSVLVVSADFRRPRLHVLFDVPREPGLTEMLDADGQAPNLRDLVRPTAVDGVRLLPSGSPTKQPANLLRSADRLLAAARTIFDYVLVDSAPMLVANDAAELAQSCDGVILMARAGRTSIAAAQRTAEMLEQVEAPVVGCVLIATTNAATSYSYYRYRYYADSATS